MCVTTTRGIAGIKNLAQLSKGREVAVRDTWVHVALRAVSSSSTGWCVAQGQIRASVRLIVVEGCFVATSKCVAEKYLEFPGLTKTPPGSQI